MDMVEVGVGFFNNEVGSELRQFFEHIQEIRLDTGSQDLSSVFSWPHKMVVTGKDSVAHSTVRDRHMPQCS